MGDLNRDEIDAHFAAVQTAMHSGFAELRQAMQRNVAAMRAEMQKNTTDIIKWVVGMISGTGALAITVMTFVLNNAVPKAPPPVIVPVAALAPPVPPSPAPR